MSDPNVELDDKLYTYGSSNVLRNKFDIRDRNELEAIERQWTDLRIDQGVPNGDFDLKHLQSIHQHLFQEIYEWAGELRQTVISKGGSVFMPPHRLEMGMEDVHNRLKDFSYLQGAPKDEFARQAGVIIGDINHLHPFREGNGRTQLQYLQKLGEHAGFDVALEHLDRDQWIEASIKSHGADYEQMQDCILSITSERTRHHEQDQSRDKGRER